MKDIRVELSGHVEEGLARLSEALGAAAVNIEGLCLTRAGDTADVHYLVGDEHAAVGALRNAGAEIVSVTDVFVLDKDHQGITGKPGSFGRICRTLAEHGVRIEFGYPAEHNRFVFGVADVAGVRGLLE